MKKTILFLFFFFLATAFASDESVFVKAKKIGDYVVVEANNDNPFSITVAYDAQYENLQCDKKFPLLFVLPSHAHLEIMKLHINGNFKYKGHYDWTIGSAYAKHDNRYLYALPFKRGTVRRVSQSYNGDFTHFGDSQYAVDFEMAQGSEVYAARGGVVIKIKEDSTKGGETKDFLHDANYITIEHSDGTLATYAHLKYNGVLVKVTDKVKQGDVIGYSGKTGMARGPHLHFIVYKAVDGKTRESFPVKFMTVEGIVDEPIQGHWYSAQ